MVIKYSGSEGIVGFQRDLPNEMQITIKRF
jgi:hypothetical protein